MKCKSTPDLHLFLPTGRGFVSGGVGVRPTRLACVKTEDKGAKYALILRR